MNFQTNIIEAAKENNFFRKVVFTGKKSQLVIMNLNPGEEIGEEIHNKVEQILFNLEGTGKVILDGEESEFNTGDVVIVGPGVKHNFINVGNINLKIYTIYTPANHLDGRIHKRKLDAENDFEDEEFGNNVQ